MNWTELPAATKPWRKSRPASAPCTRSPRRSHSTRSIWRGRPGCSGRPWTRSTPRAQLLGRPRPPPPRRGVSTTTAVLISRIMTDAEGIRNLVGTGLVQLVGGLVTAGIALGVLFWLNWQLTAMAILVLAVFGGGMAYAFTKLRPLFRDRGKLNAEVTGRLAETLGGIRIVKAYHSERSERLVFARGAHRLFRNIATTMTGISGLGAFASLVIGAIGVLMVLVGGRAILAGAMTLGDFVMYIFFVGLV